MITFEQTSLFTIVYYLFCCWSQHCWFFAFLWIFFTFRETQIRDQSNDVIVKALNFLSGEFFMQYFFRVDNKEAEDEVNESEGGKKGTNEIQMQKWKIH